MTDRLLRHDEPALVAHLERLPKVARATFACACAQRLLPAYARFHAGTGKGDPPALSSLLDRVWAELDHEATTDIGPYRGVLDTPVASDEDPWTVETGLAENAVACVAYAIDSAQTGNAQHAAWAARQVYEALDLFVRTRDDIDFNRPGSEERVLADPLVQTELARQRRDIEVLSAIPAEAVSGRVVEFRRRARHEATEMFGFGTM